MKEKMKSDEPLSTLSHPPTTPSTEGRGRGLQINTRGLEGLQPPPLSKEEAEGVSYLRCSQYSCDLIMRTFSMVLWFCLCVKMVV
ncbi:unnamed protein product [Prunus armeniaca]